MRVWALVSRESSETVELYLNRGAAYAALKEVLTDEPAFASVVHVIELDWGTDPAAAVDGASLN